MVFGPTVVTTKKAPMPVVKGPAIPLARSILNPVSLAELSFHERLIWLAEAAARSRPLGASGAVAPVLFELLLFEFEEPPAFDVETDFAVVGASPQF